MARGRARIRVRVGVRVRVRVRVWVDRASAYPRVVGRRVIVERPRVQATLLKRRKSAQAGVLFEP